MRREIVPFDDEIIRSELSDLPIKDRAKLVALIEYYEESQSGNPYPVQLNVYDHGLIRLRHAKASYQGRAILYIAESKKEFQRLVLLVIYKKESNKAPDSILVTAKKRMEQHKKEKA